MSTFDTKDLDKFIKKANVAHQQLCVWFSVNNKFVKYQDKWYGLETFGKLVKRNNFRYENFWNIVIPTLQHSWVLSTARLLDSAYLLTDKQKNKPRICLDYILTSLSNRKLEEIIRSELKGHKIFIQSIQKYRHNVQAHNDKSFVSTVVEPGVEIFLNGWKKRLTK